MNFLACSAVPFSKGNDLEKARQCPGTQLSKFIMLVVSKWLF